MEQPEEKIVAVVNKSIVNKLETISQDIKTYVNTNAAIYQSLPENEREDLILFSEEEIDYLLDIRNRVKLLHHKLQKKLS